MAVRVKMWTATGAVFVVGVVGARFTKSLPDEIYEVGPGGSGPDLYFGLLLVVAGGIAVVVAATYRGFGPAGYERDRGRSQEGAMSSVAVLWLMGLTVVVFLAAMWAKAIFIPHGCSVQQLWSANEVNRCYCSPFC